MIFETRLDVLLKSCDGYNEANAMSGHVAQASDPSSVRRVGHGSRFPKSP